MRLHARDRDGAKGLASTFQWGHSPSAGGTMKVGMLVVWTSSNGSQFVGVKYVELLSYLGETITTTLCLDYTSQLTLGLSLGLPMTFASSLKLLKGPISLVNW
jgi:hypothetical protein